MSDLYRKEAFASRIKGFSNPVSVKGSLTVSAMLIGIFLFVAGLVLFGMLTDYTRRAVVAGYLRPEAGSISVISTQPGRLFVEVLDGTEVANGQKVARIQNASTGPDGQSLTALKIENLLQAQSLMQARLDLTRSRIPVLQKQAEIALKQHDAEINIANIILDSKIAEAALSEEALERTTELSERGLMAKTALNEAQRRMLVSDQALSQAQSSFAMLKASTRRIELDWESQGIELRQSINVLDRELSNLSSQITQAQAELETGVFSPISGIVTYSAAQDGEFVTTGVPLFQITPTSSDFIANLLAPSSAVGFVKLGDIIQIRYEAFPFREHGVFLGEIIGIDSTAQLPNMIDAPMQITGPVYRITAKIEQNPISKSGQPLRLVSGMGFEASIIIDEKPLLLWLLSPVL